MFVVCACGHWSVKNHREGKRRASFIYLCVKYLSVTVTWKNGAVSLLGAVKSVDKLAAEPGPISCE